MGLPVTASSEQFRKLLQILFVHLIKPIKDRTVYVDDGHDLLRIPFSRDDRDHDLALAVSIAGDVARELLDVRDELRRLRGRRCPAHAPTEDDRLARHLTLERPQNELWFGRLLRVQRVKAWYLFISIRCDATQCERKREVDDYRECAAKKDLPAQFTWLLGRGRDLYACHSSEAAFAKLLHVVSRDARTRGLKYPDARGTHQT